MIEQNEMVVIGGPHDGERISQEYSHLPYLRLPVRQDIYSLCVGSPEDTSLPEVTSYMKTEFADQTGNAFAWLHESVSSPMKQLLDGYRKY